MLHQGRLDRFVAECRNIFRVGVNTAVKPRCPERCHSQVFRFRHDFYAAGHTFPAGVVIASAIVKVSIGP
jgi:hypothetical protein